MVWPRRLRSRKRRQASAKPVQTSNGGAGGGERGDGLSERAARFARVNEARPSAELAAEIEAGKRLPAHDFAGLRNRALIANADRAGRDRPCSIEKVNGADGEVSKRTLIVFQSGTRCSAMVQRRSMSRGMKLLSFGGPGRRASRGARGRRLASRDAIKKVRRPRVRHEDAAEHDEGKGSVHTKSRWRYAS